MTRLSAHARDGAVYAISLPRTGETALPREQTVPDESRSISDRRPSVVQRLRPLPTAALIVSRGSASFNGSSNSRSAPKRAYPAAARWSFASAASATLPTS